MAGKGKVNEGFDMKDYVAIPVLGTVLNSGEEARDTEADEAYLSIHLTETQARGIDLHLNDAAELIRDAGELLDFLATGLSLGHLDPETQGFHTILRLSRRAFRAAEITELSILDDLEISFRRDLANQSRARQDMAPGGTQQ